MEGKYIEGYTSNIDYCPFCGCEVSTEYADGSYKCDSCGKRFAVIEVDDESR